VVGASADDDGIDKLASVPIKKLAGESPEKKHKEESKKQAESLI